LAPCGGCLGTISAAEWRVADRDLKRPDIDWSGQDHALQGCDHVLTEFWETQEMQRIKTMKLSLIAALSIMPLGWANAACPDVTGQWVVAYDEVQNGDTLAGVGNLILDATTIQYWGAETTNGFGTGVYLVGQYYVDSYCNVLWEYINPDVDAFGSAAGVIISADKMYLIFATSTGHSGRAVAERLDR